MAGITSSLSPSASYATISLMGAIPNGGPATHHEGGEGSGVKENGNLELT